MVKSTRGQINYLIECINWFSVEELSQLPIPPEFARCKKGDISKEELKNILSDYSIRKTHNIICVINNHIKRS